MQNIAQSGQTSFSCGLNVCYLVIVHADIEFIVQFESQAPHDPPEPETIVGIHCLCFRCDIENVLSLVQWTHILTYTNTPLSHFTICYCMLKLLAFESLVTTVCHQKDSVFIQRFRPVQFHLIAELLDYIQSHLE